MAHILYDDQQYSRCRATVSAALAADGWTGDIPGSGCCWPRSRRSGPPWVRRRSNAGMEDVGGVSPGPLRGPRGNQEVRGCRLRGFAHGRHPGCVVPALAGAGGLAGQAAAGASGRGGGSGSGQVTEAARRGASQGVSIRALCRTPAVTVDHGAPVACRRTATTPARCASGRRRGGRRWPRGRGPCIATPASAPQPLRRLEVGDGTPAGRRSPARPTPG